jgi:hypothetical protein
LHLKKEEWEIVARIILNHLQEETFNSIIYGTEPWQKTLEKERKIFRKIKKGLDMELTEEEALMAGLIEEVSKETLEGYAAKQALLPTDIRVEKLPFIARYFLKEK